MGLEIAKDNTTLFDATAKTEASRFSEDESEDEGSTEEQKASRLSELRSSFLSVLSDNQNPIGEGEYFMSSEELEPYRLIGDGPMDKIFALLHDEGCQIGPMDDVLHMLEEKDAENSSMTPSQRAISSFRKTYFHLPSWVDIEQLKRGQEVFLAYSPAAGLALYYRSLVPGFSAPMINKVVQSTGYLTPPARPDQSLQRILDTGELLAACIGLGIESLLPGGIGWKTAIHVRALHAKVRYTLLQRTGTRSWDIEKYGIPINQEDMAATLLAFSVNVLVGIDLVSGSSLSDREKLDYLALWRYIGWLLGVETATDSRLDDEPCAFDLPQLDPCGPPRDDSFHNTIQKSYSLLQSMVNHLGDPDETSVKIAHHLLQVTDRTPPKDLKDKTEFYQNFLFYYRSLQCRKFIGDPLANALQLPLHPNLWKRSTIYITSGIAWGLFRIYTRLAIHSCFCKRIMLGFHGWNFVRFHNHWRSNHKSRLEKLAEARQKMFSIVGRRAELKPERKGGDDQTQNMCPFAMIAQPIDR